MTTFRELRAGHPLYIFDLKEIKVSQATTKEVSRPYVATTAGMSDMVVDVTAEDAGEQKTFAFKDRTCAGYDPARGLLITTDRSIIAKELETMRKASEEILKQVDNHKLIVERCAEALEAIGTEDKVAEERMNRISTSYPWGSYPPVGIMKKVGR